MLINELYICKLYICISSYTCIRVIHVLVYINYVITLPAVCDVSVTTLNTCCRISVKYV